MTAVAVRALPLRPIGGEGGRQKHRRDKGGEQKTRRQRRMEIPWRKWWSRGSLGWLAGVGFTRGGRPLAGDAAILVAAPDGGYRSFAGVG